MDFSTSFFCFQARIKAGEGWVEFKRRSDLTAHWINVNLGPYFCQLKSATREYWLLAQLKVSEGWAWLKPKVSLILKILKRRIFNWFFLDLGTLVGGATVLGPVCDLRGGGDDGRPGLGPQIWPHLRQDCRRRDIPSRCVGRSDGGRMD